MISVTIFINNVPIYTRSAVNITEIKEGWQADPIEVNKYKVDTGKIINHIPANGALVLAKKMLDTIKE